MGSLTAVAGNEGMSGSGAAAPVPASAKRRTGVRLFGLLPGMELGAAIIEDEDALQAEEPAMTGGCVSVTLTLTVSVEERPPGSVTVRVIVCGPCPRLTPRVAPAPSCVTPSDHVYERGASPSGSEEFEPSSVTVVSAHSTVKSGPASATGAWFVAGLHLPKAPAL